jgi:putative CocE/NonD family hydrolase
MVALSACAWQASGAGSVAVGFGHYQPAKQFTQQVSSSFYLPMRDGVRLAVRVTRPARDGKPVAGRFPVIWHHALGIERADPAGSVGPTAGGYTTLQQFTDYGYVTVLVARRGNGQSFGVRRGYNDRSEAYDAYEVTEWLAAQPWSNGKVGIYGCSNTGDAAMHAVSSQPPHLKAAFAGCFSWNKYDAMRRGGIFAQWGTGPQRTLEQDIAIEPVDGDADKTLLRQAATEHQLSTVLFDMWQGLPFRDSHSPLVVSRFWAEGSISSFADQIRHSGVALYIQGGWRDELRDQGLTTFLNVPGARALIGPWLHCQNPGFALGEEIHRFFDAELKGLDTGLSREAPIHYYTVNAPAGSEWRTTATWPVAAARSRRLFLGDAHELSANAPRVPLAASFVINTDLSCPGGGASPYSQPCHLQGDGLSFAAAPLGVDTEVTGDPVIELQIRSERSDADLFAYLEDVAPDGNVTEVTEGRLRASLRALADAPYKLPGIPWHRSYAEDVRPLTAGETAMLRFAMMPTSYVFKAGHRLQITVTGADHRQRDRDPAARGSRITLAADAQAASFIDLPVVSGGT